MTFDSATRVLVSDGNTARVVLHGIAAHLRQLKLEAEVALTPGRAQQVRVLARQPSVATIRGLALQAVKPSQPAETPDDTTDKASERYVIYPGPPIDRFDQNLYQERLTSALGVPVKLCTMDEWEVERTQRESCMISKALWINLSYSPCDPAKHLGITAHQMNLLGMRCAQFWLGKGERLLFGHDWRDDGVMRSIGDLAELTTPHRFTQRGLGFPRMLNVIPHPAGQRLERHGIEAQRTSSGMLSVRRLYDVVFHPENLAGRESAPGNGELDVADATIFRAARRVPWLGALLGNPQLAETSLATTDPGPPPPVTRELLYAERDETYRDKMPVYLHWNASANIRLWTLRAVLTEMLGQRTDKVNGIRICFGGKTSGYTGWMPGVFEEAVFALLRRVPLYIIGGFGGAAADVASALKYGKPEKSEQFGVSDSFDHAFDISQQKNPKEHDETFALDMAKQYRWPTTRLADKLVTMGMDALCEANGLEKEENEELFKCTDIETACSLIHLGVTRLRKSSGNNTDGA